MILLSLFRELNTVNTLRMTATELTPNKQKIGCMIRGRGVYCTLHHGLNRSLRFEFGCRSWPSLKGGSRPGYRWPCSWADVKLCAHIYAMVHLFVALGGMWSARRQRETGNLYCRLMQLSLYKGACRHRKLSHIPRTPDMQLAAPVPLLIPE